jgi:mono/diheme cytochrome c family protein
MKKVKLTALTLAATLALPVFSADKLDIGKVEYDQSCATCHCREGL